MERKVTTEAEVICGTLHITVDCDISKVYRVWLSQKGTHCGELYYPDYTEDEIQKMQDLEQAQLDKAYELGKQDAQPEPQIRCKDCRWGKEACGNIECFADANVPPEYHGYEWFCPNAERRTDG